MSAAFLVLVPAGILIARYCRHRHHIGFLHGVLMSQAGELVLTSALFAIITPTEAPQLQTHRKIGLAAAALVIATIVLAIVFASMRRFARVRPIWWMRVRLLHQFSGWAVLGFGWLNMGIGFVYLWPEYLPHFYAVVAIVGTVVLALDAYGFRVNGGFSTWLRRRSSQARLQLKQLSMSRANSSFRVAPTDAECTSPSTWQQSPLADHDGDDSDGAVTPTARGFGRRLFGRGSSSSDSSRRLPTWTLESVAMRNSAHRSICFIIVDGYVVDATAYKEHHPGGGKRSGASLLPLCLPPSADTPLVFFAMQRLSCKSTLDKTPRASSLLIWIS